MVELTLSDAWHIHDRYSKLKANGLFSLNMEGKAINIPEILGISHFPFPDYSAIELFATLKCKCFAKVLPVLFGIFDFVFLTLCVSV